MSEIIERVARAIDPEVWKRIDSGEFRQEWIRQKSYETARAAIAAIREPTAEMAYAAMRDYDFGSLGIERTIFTNTDPRLAPAIYRQMIDEALK